MQINNNEEQTPYQDCKVGNRSTGLSAVNNNNGSNNNLYAIRLSYSIDTRSSIDSTFNVSRGCFIVSDLFDCSISLLDKVVYVSSNSDSTLSGSIFLNTTNPKDDITKLRISLIGINRTQQGQKKNYVVFKNISKELDPRLASNYSVSSYHDNESDVSKIDLVSEDDEIDDHTAIKSFNFTFPIDVSFPGSIKLTNYSTSYAIKLELIDINGKALHTITEPIQIIPLAIQGSMLSNHEIPISLLDNNNLTIKTPKEIQINKDFHISMISSISNLQFDSIKIYLLQTVQKSYSSEIPIRKTITKTVLKNTENSTLQSLIKVKIPHKSNKNYQSVEVYPSYETPNFPNTKSKLKNSKLAPMTLSIKHKLKFNLIINNSQQKDEYDGGWLNKLKKSLVGTNQLFYEFEVDVNVMDEDLNFGNNHKDVDLQM